MGRRSLPKRMFPRHERVIGPLPVILAIRFQAPSGRRNRTITRSESQETYRKSPVPIAYGHRGRKHTRDSSPLQAGACR